VIEPAQDCCGGITPGVLRGPGPETLFEAVERFPFGPALIAQLTDRDVSSEITFLEGDQDLPESHDTAVHTGFDCSEGDA